MADGTELSIKDQASLSAATSLILLSQQGREDTIPPMIDQVASKGKGNEVSLGLDNNQERRTEGKFLVTADTFTQFDYLPQELRTIVWEQCIPRQRIVTPWYLSITSITPSIDPPIHQVCREARRVALKNGSLKTILRYIYGSETQSGGTYEHMRCWFNKETDFIYLEGHMHSCMGLLLAALDGSDGNEIARLAVEEPDANLLVSSSLMLYFSPLDINKLESILGYWTDDTVPRRLCDMFLQTRERVFLELWRIDIVLVGPVRDEAVRMGLVGEHEEEVAPALVHLDDTAALEKYIKLMGISPNTFIRVNSPTADARAGLEELVGLGGPKVGTHAQQDFVCFVELLAFAIYFEGGGDTRNWPSNGVIDDDGNLNVDHPLLARLDWPAMPKWTLVAVFQLLNEKRAVETADTEEPAEGYNEPETLQEIGLSLAEEVGESDTWAAVVRQLMRMPPDLEHW